jgi:glyoxylase-like metal-dependent hydrolase (beta-lactamase superfamily II)
MKGTVTVTRGRNAKILTYTAPELGWQANTHIIELASQVILFDTQLGQEFATDMIRVAQSLGKPTTRLYISHAHPDHFAGATYIDAPTYALQSVKDLIDRSGDLRIERGYRLTPGHDLNASTKSRPIDYIAKPGDEEIDGVLFRLEAIADAETTEQLVIGLPDERILMAPDVLYNGVHAFIGEHGFDAWDAAISRLEAQPYNVILPGHGLPGGRELYATARSYLKVAKAAYAQATDPDDLNQLLESAYPAYGGTAMQGLQNFYLFPRPDEEQ